MPRTSASARSICTPISTQLVERPVDPRELRRAEQLFREESVKSFSLELGDLTRDTWSLLPAAGDFLAEVRTRRFDTLTYSRSRSEPEDISLFDRRRQRNIAVYASAEKLASHGRFYNEDDLAEYDILDYDIDLIVDPERQWIEGAHHAPAGNPGAVRQPDHDGAGRIAGRALRRQRRVRLAVQPACEESEYVAREPAGRLTRDTQITLRIAYSGRLGRRRRTARRSRRSAPRRDPQPRRSVAISIGSATPEPSYLYSSRSYWYPQAPISDYATATHPDFRARHVRVRGDAASWCPAHRHSFVGRHGLAEPEGLPVHGDAAGPLSGVHREPIHAGGTDDASHSTRRRGGDGHGRR